MDTKAGETGVQRFRRREYTTRAKPPMQRMPPIATKVVDDAFQLWLARAFATAMQTHTNPISSGQYPVGISSGLRPWKTSRRRKLDMTSVLPVYLGSAHRQFRLPGAGRWTVWEC